MHRVQQCDINGDDDDGDDDDDDDVHNARMPNGALPRIRKNKIILVFWFCDVGQ